MSLGSNRAGWSFKRDIILRIQLELLHQGSMLYQEIIDHTKNFHRKTINDLKLYYKELKGKK